MTAPRRVLEFGADHQEYGSYSFGSLSEQTVWAISVGADHDSPSLQYKGDLDYRNEDGLLAIEDGDRVLIAVADGHFLPDRCSGADMGEVADRDVACQPRPGGKMNMVAHQAVVFNNSR